MIFWSYMLITASLVFGCYNFYLSDTGAISYANVWINAIVTIILFVSAVIILYREADIKEEREEDGTGKEF